MVDAGELRVKLFLDRAQFDTAMQGFHQKLRQTRSLGKELGVEFDRIGKLVKGLGIAAAAAGASFIGMMTGALLASPQFKEFTSRLKKPWFELSNFLGQEFKPVLDVLGRKFQELVDSMRGSPEARKFLGDIASSVKGLLELVGQEDMKRFIKFVSETGSKTIQITFEVSKKLKGITGKYGRVIREAGEGEPSDLIKAVQQWHNFAEWAMWGDKGKFFPGYGYLGADDYFNPDYSKYMKGPSQMWYPEWGNPEILESMRPKGPIKMNITINDPSGTMSFLGVGQIDLI